MTLLLVMPGHDSSPLDAGQQGTQQEGQQGTQQEGQQGTHRLVVSPLLRVPGGTHRLVVSPTNRTWEALIASWCHSLLSWEAKQP